MSFYFQIMEEYDDEYWGLALEMKFRNNQSYEKKIHHHDKDRVKNEKVKEKQRAITLKCRQCQDDNKTHLQGVVCVHHVGELRHQIPNRMWACCGNSPIIRKLSRAQYRLWHLATGCVTLQHHDWQKVENFYGIMIIHI